MNDDQIGQVRAVAAALFRCPPPLRSTLANDLYQQGVRIHPELATAELVVEGPANLGNWRPGHLENITRRDPFEIVQQFAPDLAQRMAAATTEEDRAAIRDEIRHKHGTRIAQIAEQIAAAGDAP